MQHNCVHSEWWLLETSLLNAVRPVKFTGKTGRILYGYFGKRVSKRHAIPAT